MLLQCYKGEECSTTIALSSPLTPSSGGSCTYEARLRSCALCSVNGREEQLWSQPSPAALCRWEEEEVAAKTAGDGEETKGVGQGKEGPSSRWNSPWTVSLLVFAVLTLLTVVVALVLGQLTV